ncbi:MAG: TIGR02996 domain-containing protein [Myxococcota bacterium]
MKLSPELWQAVQAAPDDDHPRLVLADWLEEQGEVERAAFIRVQVARAALPEHAPEDVTLGLSERVHWRPSWQQASWAEGMAWGAYHRGFVRQVRLAQAQQWIDQGAACLDATVVEGIVLPWSRMGDVGPLPSHPRLRELTVYGTIVDAADVRWLATSPILSTVRRLNLLGSEIDVDGLATLLESPHLAQLEALVLRNNALSDAAVPLLGQAKVNLRELDLTVLTQEELGSSGRYLPTLGPQGAAQLAEWSGLATVERLVLTGQQLGVEGFEALLASPHLGQLRHLSIRGCADMDWETTDLRPDVVSAFAKASPELRLTSFEMAELDLRPEGTADLVRALPGLQRLAMDRILGPKDVFNQLAEAPFVEQLRCLDVSNINSNEDFWPILLKRTPPQLHTLITTADFAWSRYVGLAEILAKSPVQPSTRRLVIQDAELTQEDVGVLGQLTTFPALEALEVTGSPLSWHELDVDFTDFVLAPLPSCVTSLVVGEESLNRLPPISKPEITYGRVYAEQQTWAF